MFDILAGALGSILSGGATGLIGTALSMWGDHKKREQDLEAQRLAQKHDLAILDREWGHRIEVAQTEAESAGEREAEASFRASLAAEPKRYLTGRAPTAIRYLLGLVDVWRGLIRPGLTTYLVVLTTLIYFQLQELSAHVVETQAAVEMMSQIVNTVLYLSTTTVLWWFGTRNKQTPPRG